MLGSKPGVLGKGKEERETYYISPIVVIVVAVVVGVVGIGLGLVMYSFGLPFQIRFWVDHRSEFHFGFLRGFLLERRVSLGLPCWVLFFDFSLDPSWMWPASMAVVAAVAGLRPVARGLWLVACGPWPVALEP